MNNEDEVVKILEKIYRIHNEKIRLNIEKQKIMVDIERFLELLKDGE